MNRTTIFCFYDRSGEVKNADEYLINELSKVSKNLIIVSNCKTSNMEVFLKFTSYVLVRQNESYDFGAYRQVILDEKFQELIRESDELLLCNNSFYGPFITFEEIFNKMKRSSCDFWGLLRYNYGLIEHIQSYFLVFRKSIIESNALLSYFSKSLSNLSYTEVCGVFENGLYLYLKYLGYIPDAYVNPSWCNIYSNPYSSIELEGLPILKKKVFSFDYFDEKSVLPLIGLVKRKFNFDLKEILDDNNDELKICMHKNDVDVNSALIPYYDITKKDDTIERKKLEGFIRSNREIFIYGAGVVAINVVSYFIGANMYDKLAGFIVSEKRDNVDEYFGKRVYSVAEIGHDLNTPIIVALSETNTLAVREKLKNYDNVFFL